MSLMAPAEFVEQYFSPKSRPSLATVQRWLANGDIPGRKIGPKMIFVDTDAFEASGNELVEKVLRDVARPKTRS